MKKRTWCYVLSPVAFDMRCDRCCPDEDLESGKGTNITWSEYEHMIWCFDCKIDTPGTPGIFDGPIPIQVSYTLGLNFNRVNLITNEIEKLNLCKALGPEGKMVWDPPKEVTKNLLAGKDCYGFDLKKEGEKHFKPLGE